MREQLGTACALGGSLSPRCGSGIGFLIPGTYVPGFLLSPLPRLNEMLPALVPRLNEMLPAPVPRLSDSRDSGESHQPAA